MGHMEPSAQLHGTQGSPSTRRPLLHTHQTTGAGDRRLWAVGAGADDRTKVVTTAQSAAFSPFPNMHKGVCKH